MTVRQRLEADERQRLSPYASFSDASAGREHTISECSLRTQYQRDRDRILHSKAFRRLKHKTQCFISPEGDHYRTRLTHTLEVAQIARTITRALRLNEDLAEAIALGHDLGHTPFGHIGERTLDALSPAGFSHYEQSLRVVDVLADGKGLNLTAETRDGILNHSLKHPAKTLEGIAVAYADRIAYLSHDIDDAVHAGVINNNDFPEHLIKSLGSTHSDRIKYMISDIILFSADKPIVSMTAATREAMDEMRAFMFERVYFRDEAKSEEIKASRMLTGLYDYYLENISFLPYDLMGINYTEGPDRAVCDAIASMTDDYAMRVFSNFFMPARTQLNL